MTRIAPLPPEVSAFGCAVHTTLGIGEKYTTVEMKVNYLRPIFPGRPERLI